MTRATLSNTTSTRAGPERTRLAVLSGISVLLLNVSSCAVAERTGQPAGGAPTNIAQPTAATRPSPSSGPAGSSSSASPAPTDDGVNKLLVIVAENRSLTDVEANMPFVMSQSRSYGTATHYYAITYPSLPNYLVLAGGSTFGVQRNGDPSKHQLSGSSVFGQLLTAGRTTKTYAEAMPTNCALRNEGTYAVRHNPWTYFHDPAERTVCRKFNVPSGTPTDGALADDIAAGTLPTFSLLIPDNCHNGHDCSSATTDQWLKSWLPAIKNGPDFSSGRLAVIITWDEDDKSSGNRVALVVIHPALKGRQVATRLDHYALSATISRLAGLRPLRNAGRAPDLLIAFGLT